METADVKDVIDNKGGLNLLGCSYLHSKKERLAPTRNGLISHLGELQRGTHVSVGEKESLLRVARIQVYFLRGILLASVTIFSSFSFWCRAHKLVPQCPNPC